MHLLKTAAKWWGGVALVLFAAPVLAAGPWSIVLPDTVQVQGGIAYLRDVSSQPVPAAAGRVVVYAGGEPNTSVRVSRQAILRKLVTAGQSGGVSLRGAEQCCLIFAGSELSTGALAGRVTEALQALVAPAISGAPDSWFEVDLPDLRISTAGNWEVRIDRRTPLEPGRNLLQVKVVSGAQTESFTASVKLHSFDEVARATRKIKKDTPLIPEQFDWQWQDLANLPQGVASGRHALEGASATRTIGAGDLVRQADLKDTPLIMAGDPVELMVVRGQVAVTVRAFARQPGCLGQTIPVRNELTGRLVNARVAGPGIVEWRR